MTDLDDLQDKTNNIYGWYLKPEFGLPDILVHDSSKLDLVIGYIQVRMYQNLISNYINMVSIIHFVTFHRKRKPIYRIKL